MLLTKWTPAPRRVRAYQNGHGVYLSQRIIRSHGHPRAHWGPGKEIAQPPRVERTREQTRAFMAYVSAQRLGYDFYH
jgi:hypothetical protein